MQRAMTRTCSGRQASGASGLAADLVGEGAGRAHQIRAGLRPAGWRRRGYDAAVSYIGRAGD